MPQTTAAIQMGALWSNESSYLGLSASGLYVRISPTLGTPKVGADFGLGVVRDQESEGATAADFNLALSAIVPLGRAVGIAPRAGVGALLGGGGGFFTVTLGSALYVRLSRGFGFRSDYTYGRLQGCEACNDQGVSSIQFGPYWGN